MPIDLIHDGDHGGDDFVTSMIFLAYPEHYNLLGITTCAGNIDVVQGGRNALMAIDFARTRTVPVYTGAAKPFRIPYLFNDEAFGNDGLGGIASELTVQGNAAEGAVDWLEHTLLAASAPLTLCVTGPMTNIALLLEKNPAVKGRIKQIIVMGGGTSPAGNIKPYAEFNFYIDPDAADFVLNSGLNIILHTLDTTQQTVYTKARQSVIKKLLPAPVTALLDRIMRITEDLEIKTFNSEGSFFHDHQVAAYLAMPENYDTKPVKARVLCDPDTTEPGRLIIEDDPSSPVHLVTKIHDTDAFFDFLVEALKRILKNYEGVSQKSAL